MTTIPDVTIAMGTGSGGTTTFSAADYGGAWGNPNGTSSFVGANSTGQGGWNLGWSMGFGANFILANWVVTNNSLTTEAFSLLVSMPIGFPGGTEFTSVGGSAVGSVTDLNGNGATLASVAGKPLYQALVDGDTLVASLFDDSFEVSTGGFGSAVIGPAIFGAPIPGDPGPLFPKSMQLELNFTLTPGDSASFSSIFVMAFSPWIPAPGAIVAFAMMGLLPGRRRR